MDLVKLLIFIGASGGFVYLSRKSLFNPHSHGFYRFLFFESILILVLLNVDYWFADPFCIRQIFSWLLLTISLLLVIHGFLILRRVGKPDDTRDDPALLGVEKTTRLVTAGAYRFIRHPIYAAAFYGVWGVFLKHPSWSGLFLVVLTVILLTTTARIEEMENILYFGDPYRAYIKKSKMFVPYLF